MARPSLADSLRASLSKGVHVDTAEKIARGLPTIPDEDSSSPVLKNQPFDVAELTSKVAPVVIVPPAVKDIVVGDVTVRHEPDNEPDRCPAHYPAKHPVNKPVIKPDNIVKPDIEPVSYPVTQPAKEPVQHPVIEPSNNPDNEPDIKPVNYPVIQQANDITAAIDPELWYPYTEKQGKVLLYLIEAGGRTKRDTIALDTGVNIATVKYVLRILVKDGFISPTNLDVNHTMRGFTYALNPHLCNEYASRIHAAGYTPAIKPANQPDNKPAYYPVNEPIRNPANKPVNYPAIKPITSFSSSSLEEKTTTTQTEILNEPELRFWAGEGVTEKQVQTWMTEFRMSPDEMALSLRYGRFDILERGDVQNAANWFYKILTRTGFYPKPTNYRSLLEIRAEALQQQQERDREALSRLKSDEFEAKFTAFLADRESRLFQQLFSQVSTFAREVYAEGNTFTAEIELRELFRAHQLKSEVTGIPVSGGSAV